MEDKPNGDGEKKEGDKQISQAPPPVQSERKEARQIGKDKNGDASEGQDQKQGRFSKWERLKKWMFPLDFNNAVMLLLTAFIALGTIVSAVAISLQFYEMHEGGIDTKTIADASSQQACSARQIAAASERNAVAAERFASSADNINIKIGLTERDFGKMAQNSADSIKATQDAMQLDQRAWMGVGSPSFVVNTHDPIKAETRVVVLGKSPAIDIVTRMGLKPFPASHTLEISDLVLDPREIHNGTAVPGSSFPVRETGADPVTGYEQAITGEIVGKTAILYFFGEVTYRDIFNQSHWTHFCYIVTGTSANADTASPCTIYNDSDADSKPKHKKPN